MGVQEEDERLITDHDKEAMEKKCEETKIRVCPDLCSLESIMNSAASYLSTTQIK